MKLTTLFLGDALELHRHIYNMNVPSQSVTFLATALKIANYAGQKRQESQDIRSAIKNIKDTVVPSPEKSGIGDKMIDDIILSKSVNEYISDEPTIVRTGNRFFHYLGSVLQGNESQGKVHNKICQLQQNTR